MTDMQSLSLAPPGPAIRRSLQTARSLLTLILILGVSFSVAVANESAEKEAATAAKAWLKLVDEGHYAMAWKEAAAYFQISVTEQAWVEALNGVRKPLGKQMSRKLKSAQRAVSLPGAPDGNYVVMQFDTRFENKATSVETITFLQEKSGEWKAGGYFIK